MNNLHLLVISIFLFFLLFGCTGQNYVVQNKLLNNYFDTNTVGAMGEVAFINVDGNALETQLGFDFNSDTNTLSADYFVGDGSGLTGLGLTDLVPYENATRDVNLGEQTIWYNNINLSNKQITYIPLGADLQDYIDDSSEGDILVLSAGTYTISSTLTNSNGFTLIGQGKDVTYLTGTNLTTSLFYLQSDNVTIQNLTINTTSNQVYAGILFSGRFGTVLENMNIINVNINASVSNATSRIVNYIDAGGIVENTNIVSYSTAGRNWGLLIEGQASAEAEPELIISNVHVYNQSATAGGYAFMAWDNGSDEYARINVYNSTFYANSGTSTSYGAYITGHHNVFNAYASYFEAYTYDAFNNGGHTAHLNGCTLGNGKSLYMTFSTIVGNQVDLYTLSSYSGILQKWMARNGQTTYFLQMNAETIAGVVRYTLDLTNNGTQYLNNLVLDRGNVGISKIPAFALDILGDLALEDSYKAYFGNAQDASIYYDAINLIINPKEVGSGDLNILSNVHIDETLDANRIFTENTYHAYGGFQDETETLSIDADTWTHVTNSDNNLWTGLEVDGLTFLNDELVTTYAADYDGVLSITFEGGNSKDYLFRIYNIADGSVAGYHIGASGLGNGNYTNAAIPIYLEAGAGDNYQFQVYTADGTDAMFLNAIFHISYLHGGID